MCKTRSKQKSEERGFTLIELIIVIVILGIMAGVAFPKFIGLSDDARKSTGRGVAGAISSTIAARHANFLLNGTNTYTVSDIITDTQLASGVATPTASGNTISWVSGPNIYQWNYTAVNGDTSAFISETGGNW